MSAENRQQITIEKSLHLKNAFVQSIDYTSASRPVLTQTVAVEGRIHVGSSGRTVYRVSEDNGKTWTETSEWCGEVRKVGDRTVKRHAPNYFLEPSAGVLVEFSGTFEEGPEGDYASFGPDQDGTPPQSRTGRIMYRLSRDDGQTWDSERQIIQRGTGYDEVHWAGGIWYEKNSGYGNTPVRLRDGTIVLPISFNTLDPDGKTISYADRFGEVKWPVEGVACLVGRWRDDYSDIDWEMSNHVTVPEHVSWGLCEPAVAELDDGTLMMVMRGCSGPLQTIPSVKFYTLSRDGGKTWGPAVPVTYPDCTYMYSPASFLNLFRSSKNGRVYLIANILPGPTKQCDPRYPLKIAEIDQDYYWVIPETETIIEDRQERHGRLVRFSNWRGIQDRETGNPVIYMTEARADAILPDPEEQPIITDSYRCEICLPG